MDKYSCLVIDAWMREAQEVSRVVEDVESRIKNQDLDKQHRLKDFAKSKVLDVGAQLDRLESLLLNPPSKPILTMDDLEFRWNMLSEFRLRTRALASSLYPSSSRKGGRNSPASDIEQTNKPTDGDNQDCIKSLSSKDESEVLEPLISENATQNTMLTKQTGSLTPMRILKILGWTIVSILGAALLLFLLFIICAVI